MHVVLLHDSFSCEFEVFRLFSKSAVRTKKGCRFWDLVRFLNDINLCICEKLTLKPDIWRLVCANDETALSETLLSVSEFDFL